MYEVDFAQVGALFGILFLFWFGASSPWWAYQLFREASSMPPPEARD